LKNLRELLQTDSAITQLFMEKDFVEELLEALPWSFCQGLNLSFEALVFLRDIHSSFYLKGPVEVITRFRNRP
jgi:hypothetical protein